MWWCQGSDKSGDGEQAVRGSLLGDHSLWIRFVAVSAVLAPGRLGLVGYIPFCSISWDVMGQAGSALPGVVV